MNAKEANNLAKQGDFGNQLLSAISDIKEAAKEGSFRVLLNSNSYTSEALRLELIKLGYFVRFGSDNTLIVSWADVKD
jgi:hypothetical protein